MKVIGIGVDLVANSRLQSIIQRAHKDRFLSKVLHTSEITLFNQKLNLQQQTQYLASRWACKEAIVKASQIKDIHFPSIEIRSQGNGTLIMFNETSSYLIYRKARYIPAW